jgi:insertion element IS1 protein InsB
VHQVNEEYMQKHQALEALIVCAEKPPTAQRTKTEVPEVEMDEMWSFVHDKSQQYWLWWAIDHKNGVPLAYCFGTRKHKTLEALQALLEPFRITIVYADNNYAYKKLIQESEVKTGKRNTQRIERTHVSLRTWCSRLVRNGIRFSKDKLMHRIVVGIIINHKFFARNLPSHLI